MNNNLNIDNIKQCWETQTNKKQYSQKELISMLNKRSRNTVKYIVTISIIEFIILILSLVSSLTTDRNIILNSLDPKGKETYILEMKISDILIYTNIIISVTFIYYLYKSYKKINLLSSTSELIKNILTFKMQINWFIVINIVIGLIILFFTSFYDFMYLIKMKHSFYEEGILKSINIPFSSPKYILMFITICLIFILVSVLYYWLIYGTLLKRLKKSLKELKKLEIN